MRARPGCLLVPVRDYNTLAHLDWVVRETNTDVRDIVVVTIRLMSGSDPGVVLERDERTALWALSQDYTGPDGEPRRRRIPLT